MTAQRRRMAAYVLLALSVALALSGVKAAFDRLDDQAKAHARQAQQADLDRADIKRLLTDGQTLLQEVKAASDAAQGALAAIQDCTTAGGACKGQGEAATARAIDQIVSRINAALARLSDVSAQNAQLQRQVGQLAAEAATLRAAVDQMRANPQAPAPLPPTPVLCQLVRC